MERVVNSKNPDPFEIDKAKRVLKVSRITVSWSEVLLSLFQFSSFIMCKVFEGLLDLNLQEQEQSLVDAIARLTDASDGESGKYI